VKSVGKEGAKEGEKTGGLDAVYRLPHRVRDMVGAWGGGVREFGEGPGYLFGGKGGVVLVTCEAEERGRWVFWGKKVVKERFRHFSQIGGPW